MTGGTGSIGSKVFETLQAVKDIRIVLFTRKPQSLNYHPNVSVMALNLKDPQYFEKKFKEAVKFLRGPPDHLFLCHGIVDEKMLIETNLLQWDSIMNVNLRASF